MWSQLARFYTQFTKDMEAKLTARAMLDVLKKEMSLEEINLSEKLVKEWLNNN